MGGLAFLSEGWSCCCAVGFVGSGVASYVGFAFASPVPFVFIVGGVAVDAAVIPSIFTIHGDDHIVNSRECVFGVDGAGVVGDVHLSSLMRLRMAWAVGGSGVP